MAGKKTLENTTAQPDSVLGKQVDFAREALADIAKAEEIGQHLRVEAADERVVTHFFECLKFGYRGWMWAVTLARVPHARLGTVCETDLLPGEGALLAPPWIPWEQRLQPGDLGRKDTTPYDPDDPFWTKAMKPVGKMPMRLQCGNQAWGGNVSLIERDVTQRLNVGCITRIPEQN